jgi:hypothetical protein
LRNSTPLTVRNSRSDGQEKSAAAAFFWDLALRDCSLSVGVRPAGCPRISSRSARRGNGKFHKAAQRLCGFYLPHISELAERRCPSPFRDTLGSFFELAVGCEFDRQNIYRSSWDFWETEDAASSWLLIHKLASSVERRQKQYSRRRRVTSGLPRVGEGYRRKRPPMEAALHQSEGCGDAQTQPCGANHCHHERNVPRVFRNRAPYSFYAKGAHSFHSRQIGPLLISN